MTLDRQDLMAASQVIPQRTMAVSESIVRSLHADPATREWVTLETEALAPIPLTIEGTPALGCVLAVRDKASGDFVPPWGAIIWQFPNGQVLEKIDLPPQAERQRLDDPLSAISPGNAAAQEHALFKALDDALGHGSTDFHALAPLCRVTLSPSALACYAWIFPQSRSWLSTTGTAPPVVSAVANQPVSDAPLEEQVGDWLRRARAISEASNASTIVRRVDDLLSRRHLSNWRLAVVGEFNSGKSSLICRLLDQPDLLPTGDIATTGLIISVIAGPQPCLEVRRPDGGVEERPLVHESWSDLLATDKRGQPRAVFAQARVTAANDWLRGLDIEIVDTPGTADLEERNAAVMTEAVAHCDAACLTIAATRPFARSEQAFLEEDILRRGGLAKVVVVVTKLDLVPQHQRQAVIDSVTARVTAISPDIAVLNGPVSPDDRNVIQALREQVTTMSLPRQRHRARSLQIASQLSLVLDELATLVRLGREQANRHRADRAKTLQAFEADLVRADAQWLDLSDHMTRQRRQSLTCLHDMLQRAEGDALEVFMREIDIVPDPKSWWERDLPFRLRRELLGLQATMEKTLNPRIAADERWLHDTVARFYSGVRAGGGQAVQIEEEKLGAPSLHLPDIRRQQLYARLATGALILGTAFLAGPFAMATSVVAGLASERIFASTLEEQRPKMRNALNKHIRDAYAGLMQRGSAQVTAAYDAMLRTTREQIDLWRQSQMEAYRGKISSLVAGSQNPAEDCVIALRQTIDAVIEQTKHERINP